MPFPPGNEALHDAVRPSSQSVNFVESFCHKGVGNLAVIGLFNGLCVTRLNMSAFVPTLSPDRLRKHPGKD
jgi:hypothetical protein